MKAEIYQATNTIQGYNKVVTLKHEKSIPDGILKEAKGLAIRTVAKAGGELTDLIIVLRTENAVRTFSGNFHFLVGTGLSAAAGIVGRVAEADVHAGVGGCAACYTYGCSKGAFIGCSLEGNIIATRTEENSRFYGNPSINASDILLGLLPRPPPAAVLYHSLSNLFAKLES